MSTSSKIPLSTMALAPRTPSSAGWKTSLNVPFRLFLFCISQRAMASPKAVWLSCPQACISPGCLERKPSLLGRCSGSSVSSTGLQSMSKRKAVTGPSRPVFSTATQPVYSSMLLIKSSGTPSLIARLMAARTTSGFRPRTASGLMIRLPKRISVNPSAFKRSTTIYVV